MKIEFLAKDSPPDGPAIATIESAGRHGVVVHPVGRGGKGASEATAAVDSCRPSTREELGREPNGDEMVAALLASEHATRCRKID